MVYRFNPEGGRVIGKISIVNEVDNQDVVTILEYGMYSHESQSISTGKGTSTESSQSTHLRPLPE